VHVVQVGNGGQTFSPSDLRVNPGEMVQFQFMGGNHTATQSNFDNPCQPINAFNATNPGFHSGFIPAAASASMGQIATYTIMVNDTRAIWVYCAQGRHCEGGMNMVINAK
jgi:plastocyanin